MSAPRCAILSPGTPLYLRLAFIRSSPLAHPQFPAPPIRNISCPHGSWADPEAAWMPPPMSWEGHRQTPRGAPPRTRRLRRGHGHLRRPRRGHGRLHQGTERLRRRHGRPCRWHRAAVSCTGGQAVAPPPKVKPWQRRARPPPPPSGLSPGTSTGGHRPGAAETRVVRNFVLECARGSDVLAKFRATGAAFGKEADVEGPKPRPVAPKLVGNRGRDHRNGLRYIRCAGR